MFFKYFKNVAKRRIISIVIVALFLVLTCALLQTDLSPVVYNFKFSDVENISCHYSFDDSALPRIEEEEISNIPQKSIFFHETSCRGQLNSRQACSIESAVRTHPEWQINVLFAGAVTNKNLNNGSLNIIKEFRNVKLYSLHIVEYAKGTPLEDLVRSGALTKSYWPISHSSDVLRYLSLYKWGGVYLDLDLVVVKSFQGLVQNWAARESNTVVAAGALSFSRDQLGRNVADAAMRDLKAKFRGDVWGHNGPGVITRLLKEMCNTNDLTKMSEATCKGFGVYGPEVFYPVPYTDAKRYFRPVELDMNVSYAFHVWNKLTYDVKVEKNSAYAKLAQQFCPSTYNMYGDKFGS